MALMLAVLALASTATGSTGLRATFIKQIPAYKSSGEHVRIAWRLRDASGQPVSLKRVFVRIVCPTGTDYTTTFARTTGPGLYAATAIVPPGGIGTVMIGAKGATIRITNPFHR
jgi:hypothetical protein